MTKVLRDELTDRGTATPYQIVKNISKYSSIYAETIKEILDHPKENTFVYNKYVQGSGAILFSELLKLVGFERTRGHIDMGEGDYGDEDYGAEEEEDEEIRDEKRKLTPISESKEESEDEERVLKIKTQKKRLDSRKKSRFSIITGETVSGAEIDRVVDKIFNDPRNRHGQYIQVIIGSQVIGEGKSLKNVRQIHIQTPHWNNPETEQAIGRGIRAFSHEDLDPEDRSVKIFRHASIPKRGIESVNYMMYKISEDKDFKMKRIERLCKEEAVNCALNWDRNNLDTDKDGSKECDYMKCKYTCSHITEKTIDNPTRIDDTYNLFYAETEIETVTNVIKQIFRKKFSYDLGELLLYFQGTSSMVIVRALKKIIDKSIVLINRYGMPSYMREDHNLYFLVDDITLPDSFLLSRYSEFPNVKPYYNFEDIIKIAQYRYIIEDKVYLIENLSESDDKQLAIDQIENLVPSLQELFIEMAITGNKNKIESGKWIRNVIVDHYKNYIIKTKDKTISTLLQETENKFRCFPNITNTVNKGGNEKDLISDWVDCDDNVVDEIEDVKIEEKVNLEMNPYGYYGRMNEKNQFQVVKIEKTMADKRKMGRTPVCSFIRKPEIAEKIDRINFNGLNIRPPIDIVMKDRNKFIKDIIMKNPKFKEKDLKKRSDDEVKSIYYWYVKASKNVMCDAIEAFFKSKNLIEY